MRLPKQGVRILSSSSLRRDVAAFASIVALLGATPAAAQDRVEDAGNTREPLRTRLALGPQLYPSYPGSDEFDVGPLIDVERARGDRPFKFEAPDESFGFSLVDVGGFSIGPVANWEGKRKATDVGADVPEVDFSIEVGAGASYFFGENFRVRAELRKGITGHEGLIGTASADLVLRDRDRWLFSIGPRVTWSDDEYQATWFGVTPAAAVTSGLSVYDPGGGIQAVGATASFLRQLTPRWGIYSYAKYDRLVNDPADSPLVTQLGSQDQFSGGLALTYTFGRNVR